jgi:putative phosphoribosyl transferase
MQAPHEKISSPAEREPAMTSTTASVTIPIDDGELHGDLVVPAGARGLVIFAHGSGSSRRSERNRAVARVLQHRDLATLLFDLLTADEEHADAVDAHLRFDIPLLARRLGIATDWVKRQPALRSLPLGYFGASTGAAAAIMVAAARAHEVAAVVSRGGRPELAGTALSQVRAPTLLIVGGADTAVLKLNREALAKIPALKQLAIIPDASHLFEERGALDEVARLAGAWLSTHLAAKQPSASTSEH